MSSSSSLSDLGTKMRMLVRLELHCRRFSRAHLSVRPSRERDKCIPDSERPKREPERRERGRERKKRRSESALSTALAKACWRRRACTSSTTWKSRKDALRARARVSVPPPWQEGADAQAHPAACASHLDRGYRRALAWLARRNVRRRVGAVGRAAVARLDPGRVEGAAGDQRRRRRGERHLRAREGSVQDLSDGRRQRQRTHPLSERSSTKAESERKGEQGARAGPSRGDPRRRIAEQSHARRSCELRSRRGDRTAARQDGRMQGPLAPLSADFAKVPRRAGRGRLAPPRGTSRSMKM